MGLAAPAQTPSGKIVRPASAVFPGPRSRPRVSNRQARALLIGDARVNFYILAVIEKPAILNDKLGFLSTDGGAMLEFFLKGKLPAMRLFFALEFAQIVQEPRPY